MLRCSATRNGNSCLVRELGDTLQKNWQAEVRKLESITNELPPTVEDSNDPRVQARLFDFIYQSIAMGYFGGVFRATAGLQKKHGKTRVFDTPINECGIIGVAVGMGAYGLRPVPEIQFADYIYPGFDQLVSEAARLRYRSAGEFKIGRAHV